jgi:hypothetical protein
MRAVQRSFLSKALLCGLAAVCLSGGNPLLATERHEQVTREEAANLVRVLLASERYETRSPKFGLETDPDQADFPEFYFFSAYYVQDHSAPTLGHFAVNRGNADLWDRELCKKLKASKLRAEQRSLREKLGLSERDLRRKSEIAPCSGPT